VIAPGASGQLREARVGAVILRVQRSCGAEHWCLGCPEAPARITGR